MKRVNYLIMIFLALGIKVYGQDIEEDLFDLSLEELMNIEIVSASKKAESSFKSPLSSTVLTNDEIMASGATTIEEALRLVPGMLIREETNGNFDVHIRGNDNLPPGNFSFYSENSMSLVMIDGRPVYNYANGGTFWETLPISLVDVERIEVVRGPSTALYGPNAVTGAINIITRDPESKGISVHGNAQFGTKNTSIVDLSAGTSLMENKLKIRVSGNLENRERDQETYYAFALGEYVPGEQVPDYNGGGLDPSRFPNPEKAKERKGINAFLDFNPNQNINFQLAGGLQDSYAQQVFNENTAAVLTNRASESKYVDLKANIHGLSAQLSYNKGMQDIMAGRNLDYSKFDFVNSFVNVEYDFNIGNLTLRPGFNYQDATYTDLAYGGGEGEGYLNAERNLSNFGYFLRADYTPTEKLRLIAALRNDHYNVSDEKNYLTYQFVGNYSFNDNHLLRAVYSKANRGPFMIDSYVNYDEGNGVSNPPYIQYLGSENLPLPVMNMIELGYRGILSSKLTLDLEVFHSETSDITSFEPTFFDFDSYGLHLIYQYVPLDLKARQTGATFSFNFAPSSKVQLRAYATVQQTKLENYDKKLSPAYFDLNTFTPYLPQTERMDITHKQTPSVYGGLTGNFRPIDRFNLYAGVYYLGAHTYRHDYASYEEEKGEVEVAGRTLVNIKASYNVYKQNSIFINARNVFNSKGQEFGFADEIGGLYLAGISLSF
jgi:iron complex outermembrane receptor protein